MSATRGAKVIHAFDATFNDYALAISFTNDRPLEKKIHLTGPHRRTKTIQTQNLNLICYTQDLAPMYNIR